MLHRTRSVGEELPAKGLGHPLYTGVSVRGCTASLLARACEDTVGYSYRKVPGTAQILPVPISVTNQ